MHSRSARSHAKASTKAAIIKAGGGMAGSRGPDVASSGEGGDLRATSRVGAIKGRGSGGGRHDAKAARPPRPPPPPPPPPAPPPTPSCGSSCRQQARTFLAVIGFQKCGTTAFRSTLARATARECATNGGGVAVPSHEGCPAPLHPLGSWEYVLKASKRIADPCGNATALACVNPGSVHNLYPFGPTMTLPATIPGRQVQSEAVEARSRAGDQRQQLAGTVPVGPLGTPAPPRVPTMARVTIAIFVREPAARAFSAYTMFRSWAAGPPVVALAHRLTFDQLVRRNIAEYLNATENGTTLNQSTSNGRLGGPPTASTSAASVVPRAPISAAGDEAAEPGSGEAIIGGADHRQRRAMRTSVRSAAASDGRRLAAVRTSPAAEAKMVADNLRRKNKAAELLRKRKAAADKKLKGPRPVATVRPSRGGKAPSLTSKVAAPVHVCALGWAHTWSDVVCPGRFHMHTTRFEAALRRSYGGDRGGDGGDGGAASTSVTGAPTLHVMIAERAQKDPILEYNRLLSAAGMPTLRSLPALSAHSSRSHTYDERRSATMRPPLRVTGAAIRAFLRDDTEAFYGWLGYRIEEWDRWEEHLGKS